MRLRFHTGLLVGALALLWPACASADYLSDGRKSFAKGDMRTAVVQLRNAVRTDPKNAEAHYLLAKIQYELGDAVAAQKEAKNAVALGFDKQQVLPMLASTYLLQGKYAELLEDFQVENQNALVDSIILDARGFAYTGLQQLDEAAKAFNDAETLAPNSLQPAIAGARLALSRGDLETAQKKLERAERIAPGAADVQLLRSQILRMQNNPQGALDLLNLLISKQPNNLKARMDRASLLLAMGRDQEAKADNDHILWQKWNDVGATFMRALLAARARDFTAADVELDKINRFLGRIPKAYYLRAVVKQNLNQLEQAEEAAASYSAREPNDIDGVKLLARIQLLKRKPIPVINTLNSVIASGRGDFDIYDLLGRALSMDGQASEAVAAFHQAQLLAPEDLGVNARLASARLRAGETDAAIVDLEHSLRLAPTDAAISEQLFAAALATGDLTKADEALGKVKAALGDTPTVGNLEAVLLMARMDLAGARNKLQDVIRRSPDFTLAQYNLARLAMMEGNKDEADQLLAGILSKHPASDPALSMYVGGLVGGGRSFQAIEVLKRASAEQPTNHRIIAALADLYVRSGDLKNAQTLLNISQRLNLVPMDLLAVRARTELALGQMKNARDTYAELLDRDRSVIAVRRALAELLINLGSFESARTTLEDGLKLDPQSFQLMQDLVAIDFSVSGMEAALVTADKFERLNHDFPPAWALRGDVYMAAQRWDDAIAAYTKALNKFPNPPTLLMIRLGKAQYSSGNSAAADRTLRQWVASHPDDMSALRFQAEQDLRQQRFAEAEQDFLKLLEQRPRDPEFLNNLAWLYYQRGDKRARSVAQQAYVLQPIAEIADTLGWILLGEGETAKALVLLRQANGEAVNNPQIGYHYAVALHKAGRDSEALKVLKPIIDSDAVFDERTAATKFLTDLNKGA